MKRKEFFSFGLYLEGLRRVRLPGIIFLVLMILESVLIPLGYIIEEYSYRIRMEEIGESFTIEPNSISMLEVHPFILISFLIIVPVLTWTLFSFLNKRNASDFYHSLPHTRLAIYVSNVSALVTWIAGIVVLPTLISRIMLASFPDVFSVVPNTYVPITLGCLAASMLVAAVIIVAMCITGTLFTNVIVSGLIMYFPRYVLLFITMAVSTAFPLVPAEYVSPLLGVDVNIITGLSIGGLIYSGDGDCLVSGMSQLYTVALAVVYLIIGAVLFYRRKSESADRSAPSPLIQMIYRIAIAMTICVPICFLLFTEEFEYSEEYFVVFILYLIAALAYFIYELITTRKWKNLIKALPGLGIVVLLNVALIVSMSVITSVEKGFSPKAEEIDHISIVVDDILGDWYEVPFFEYAQAEASEVKITDERALQVVADALDESIKYAEKYGTINNYGGSSSYVETYTTYTFKIKAGLAEKYRTLRLNSSEMDKIQSALSSSEGYADAWLLLPEAQRGTVSINIGNYTVDGDLAEGVLEVMQDEVAGIDFKEWHTFLSENIYTSNMKIAYTTNGTNISVPISAELLPKTTKAYFEAVFATQVENSEDILALLGSADGDDVDLNYAELYVPDKNGAYSVYNLINYSDSVLEDLYECIDTARPAFGDAFMMLNLIEIHEVEYDSEGFVYYESSTGHDAVVKIKDGMLETITDYFDFDKYKK